MKAWLIQSFILVGIMTACLAAPRSMAQDNPAPAPERKLPAFWKPGLRVTYQSGNSVVSDATAVVEDNQGNFVDPTTGQLRTPNSGGVGYQQLNVLAAMPELIAVESRDFLITDLQRNLTATTGSRAIVGSGEGLGEFWIPPTKLAAMKEQDADGVKIARNDYALRGRTYKAVSIRKTSPNGYTNATYDTETGLLLALAAATGDAPADPTDPNGQKRAHLNHAVLVSVRQLDLPGAEEAAPEWVQAGRQLEYQGSTTALIEGGFPLPGQPISVSLAFDKMPKPGIVVAKSTTRSGLGAGLPVQESTVERCFGGAMLSGAWIAPKALAKLEPNQVLDSDPFTGFRITFSGVQGRLAIMTEQGPAETTQTAFDTESGMLMAVQSIRQNGPGGRVQTTLQLTGRR